MEKIHVLNAKERVKGFEEIEKPFSKEQAKKEAERCLQCAEPFCQKGCPAGINCRDFIKKIKEENCQGALQTILEENPLPSFTCRGCNSEQQCEGSCILAKKGEAIQIRALERFAVENSELKNINADTSKTSVAIVGSGPAGLAAAIELQKAGIKPVIFEKEVFFAGLLNVIPEYRIPKKTILEAVGWMHSQGIEMKKNFEIGTKKLLGELLVEFDAVLIATGETLEKKLAHKELEGIHYWREFLVKHSHNGHKKISEKKCIVIGGGDTAMDCARTAMRMGFGTKIVYRKNLAFMPCRKKEYKEAIEEGVQFDYLLSPLEFIGNPKLEKIKFQKVEIKKEEFVPTEEAVEMPADLAVLAIGQEFDEIVFKASQLQGKPLKEENTKTEIPGVFIAGDSVNRNKTIVHAIQSAKKAVEEIIAYTKEKKQKQKENTTHQSDVLLGA